MECGLTSKKMVATLQSRKDALEAKLREKTVELKKLCIQEAELTGILPPETPMEPGESPPVFRRRIGTAFTYPENLINKLKSKEEEALAKLELECKVQTSIAEAALGLANDLNASKSIRRKHRLEYQQSQRRLAELETRLNVLRQSIRNSNQLKQQRKKPRPPLHVEADCVDGPELAPDDLSGHFNHMHEKPSTLPSMSRNVIRNSHVYNSFGKSSAHNYAGAGCVPQHSSSYQPPRPTQWSRNQQYRRSVERTHHNSACYEDGGGGVSWLEEANGAWRNTAPIGYFSNQCYTTLPGDSAARTKCRYGSLDRRYRNGGVHYATAAPSDFASCATSQPPPLPAQAAAIQRISPIVYAEVFCQNTHTVHDCQPLPSPSPSSASSINSIANVVLLPNQTYPENSLMRTQSLSNVEPHTPRIDSLQEKIAGAGAGAFGDAALSNTLGRKIREKEWRETALDSECYEAASHTPPLLHPRTSKIAESPTPQRPTSIRNVCTPPPPLPPPHSVTPSSPPPPLPPPVTSCRSPMKSPVLVDTVPFESPKNHTVVEVGKWQPYREVTKPFEMSDFYKYSTKFRKNNEQQMCTKNGNTNAETNPSQQHRKDNASLRSETLQENVPKADEDINRNSVGQAAPYYDPAFLSNITHRRYLPLTAVTDGNDNNLIVQQWGT